MEYRGVALVTGAAGFMGSHLVEYLAGRGRESPGHFQAAFRPLLFRKTGGGIRTGGCYQTRDPAASV